MFFIAGFILDEKQYTLGFLSDLTIDLTIACSLAPLPITRIFLS